MTPPTTSLQPGSQGPAVQQLQQWLVQTGFMTQAQMNSGAGIYGPQTTAAVKAMQDKLGVDNSSGPGYYGPHTISAVQTILGPTQKTTQSQSTAPTQTQQQNNTQSGITFSPTGDSTLDQVLNGIKGVADNLVTSGYTVPPNLQITPDLVAQFLTYAHQAVDPYTQQLLASKLKDVNSSLDAMSKTYQNQVGERQQQFGTDLANEQNTAGGNGTAFSGQRAVNENNLAATANRDLSSLGVNAAYSIGNSARSGAAAVGSDNASSILLPSLSTGSVSLNGGQRGSTGQGDALNYNYDPSIYTVGDIPSQGKNNANNLQQSYLSQYGTLAGNNSASGRSAADLLGMMSGLPAGYKVPTNLT